MPTGANTMEAELLAAIASAMREGNSLRASQMAEKALSLGIRHALPFQARAMHLDLSGRGEEALADFRNAQSLSPNDPMVANGIAICLGRMGRVAEATEQFDIARKLDPGLVSTHLHMASMLEMNGLPARARDAYRNAATLAPHLAAGWAGLAATARDCGDWNEARTAAARAVAIDPREPRAIQALAAAEFREGLLDSAERRLRQALASPGLLPRAFRASMLGLLGDILDRQDKTADAFACYGAANQERRSNYAARRSTLNMAAVVRDLMACFDSTYARDWTPPISSGPDDAGAEGHVFLLGFPRSGTTVLEQVLAAHPDVTTLEESDVLDAPAEKFLCDAAGLARLTSLQGEALATLRREYWNGVRRHGAALRGKVFVDKLPLNTIKLPLIATLFPEAKVIFAIRDPRDVVFSCFRRQLPVNASTIELATLEGCARFYDSVMALGEICRERLPLSFLILRHEDLVRDFEGETRRLCAFAGIDWMDCLRDFAAIARHRNIRSISAEQVRQGLNGGGEGQWRRYASQLKPVLPVLARWVRAFGYNPE